MDKKTKLKMIVSTFFIWLIIMAAGGYWFIQSIENESQEAADYCEKIYKKEYSMEIFSLSPGHYCDGEEMKKVINRATNHEAWVYGDSTNPLIIKPEDL